MKFWKWNMYIKSNSGQFSLKFSCKYSICRKIILNSVQFKWFFRKLFKFLFKFCTTFWILHIWCYLIGYVDGTTASRRYGEERQDDYDDDGPPLSLCETQISGKELLERQTHKLTDKEINRPYTHCYFIKLNR